MIIVAAVLAPRTIRIPVTVPVTPRTEPFHGSVVDRLKGLLGELFNGGHRTVVRCRNEHDGKPLRSRAARAADAVHIVFRHIGHVVIDDDGKLFNIKTARGNVGCHENFALALFEGFKRGRAFFLRFVPVNGVGLDARLREGPRETPACDLGVHEHPGF